MPANPILHRMLHNPYFYLWIAALALPFLFWAILARLARNNPGVLPRVYPVLKVLTWGMWFAALAAACFRLFWPDVKMYLPSFIGISGGMNLVHNWVRRRVDPDSYKKYEGWWPTKPDSPNITTGKTL
jgi:hypothetical protein